MNSKLKMLIVDDEAYIRSLLKYIIDWEELGIDICGEASCAEEALLLVDELQPNIVFSDICMDYMDGIEFSKIVKQRYPYTKIIVLSGHSEFDFAARGIEAGISAYLLKPLEEEKIIAVVKDLKEKIVHERSKADELLMVKNYLDDSREYLINSQLNALLLPATDIADIIKRLTYLKVTFSNPFFQVVTFPLHPLESENMTNQENPFLLSMECQHILQEAFEKIPDTYLFFDPNHQNVLLSNHPELDLSAILEEIKIILLERLSCNFTIGVGQPFSTLKNIRQSYLSALEAAHYRTILGNNQIIQFNYMSTKQTDSSFQLERAVPELMTAIKAENAKEAYHIIEECITHQIAVDCSDIIPVRITATTIINHLSNLLIQNNLRQTDSFSFCLTAYERLFRLETVEELRNMLCNLTRSIIETLADIRNAHSTSVMESILTYLDSNYQDSSLTLSLTAKKFYLNSSYLSRLFKQKNDTTYSKYLTDLRLKKAADLLLTTNLKAYEIGSEVGFRDAKYFSLCFKKYYGMTTNEYRAKL